MAEEPGGDRPGPTPGGFDEQFRAVAVSAGLRRVWRAADPDLPEQIEPFSFLSAGLLDDVARALELAADQRLVDLACGRGGPGMWLARQAGAEVTGVDFSPVAVAQAGQRAVQFGLAGRARFVVADLGATGLPDRHADAVVCIDALHFAADHIAAAVEALRILRPGRRLVATNWQPRARGEARLPALMRDVDWTGILTAAGFVDVGVEARAEWHDFFTRIYRLALDEGETADDVALARLQEEAGRVLPTADLVDRVLITATRPAD